MDLLDSILKLQEKYDDPDIVVKASDIKRPQSALDREMFEDANKRLNQADGGMLVQPSADGSRPGYSKDKTKTLKKMDIAGRSATGETIDLKKVQELVTKANQGNKYITAEDIAAQYYKNKKIGKQYIREYKGKKTKKFPRLWGSPAVNEILKTLDPKELKVQKVIEDMLADENPFTTGKLKNTNKNLSDLQFSKMAPWKQYISNETGLAYKGIESSLNSKNFMDGWYKNNRATLISFGQIKKDLEGLSFSQQLNYAKDVKGNKPVYTRIEKTRSSVFDIMDYALRSWNNTKGKGPIQFFDKNGNIIKWQINKKLPYSQVSFKYDGNTYSVGGSNNTISLRKSGNTFFPEVYEQNSFKNKLYDTLVDNPFKPGKEIPFGKLMNLIQNKGYGWKKGTGVLDILHGPNGVALEPFTNLSFGTRDLNLTLSQIDKIPIKGLKNKYINILTKDFKGKSGEELIQAIINQQTNLASKIAAGEKFIIPTRTQLFLDTLDPDKRIIGDVGKNTEKYIRQKIYEQTRASSKLKPNVVSEIKNKVAMLGGGKCARGFKNQGGRVGLQDGTLSVDTCFTNALERIRKGGVDFTQAEANNFSKLTKGLRAVGASNIIKFGVLPEILFEGALIADKMASEGDSFAQGLRNSYLAIPFQALGVAKTYEEGEKDRILAAAPESQKGKILDVFNLQDKLNKKFELMGASEGFKKQIAATDVVSDGPLGYVGDSQDLQKRLSDTRADLQDLYKGDASRAERILTSKPIDLNIQDQLTMDAFKTATEKADADKASNILFAPGAGFGIDTQIRKRMKELPVTPELAKEQLQATGDYFGRGYTPFGMNKLFTLMGREDPRFGYDETGKYSEEKGLNDFMNYLRSQQVADAGGIANLAGGGIAKLAGDSSGRPPESGPNSQGLQGLMKRVKNL